MVLEPAVQKRRGRRKTEAVSTEESSDVNKAQKSRPRRKRITPEQLAVLEPSFEKCDTPNFEQRQVLSAQTGMTNREVQIWAQNRRAKRTRTMTAKTSTSPSLSHPTAVTASASPDPSHPGRHTPQTMPRPSLLFDACLHHHESEADDAWFSDDCTSDSSARRTTPPQPRMVARPSVPPNTNSWRDGVPDWFRPALYPLSGDTPMANKNWCRQPVTDRNRLSKEAHTPPDSHRPRLPTPRTNHLHLSPDLPCFELPPVLPVPDNLLPSIQFEGWPTSSLRRVGNKA